MKRRQFLEFTSAALPAAALGGCGKGVGLDRTGVRALGHSLLPTEVGMDAHVRISDAFAEWAHGIHEGAELNHGYGTGELRFAGASPVPRWKQQLEALEQESRSHYGAGLEFLNDHQRLQLVRDAVAGSAPGRLPAPQDAEHVAVAILAFFYSSPEATDLAYRAAIRKEQCRPLAQSPHKPVAL